ncbi:hypothetical protein PoB_001741100 [Plakobranchus ocellatus]|uniref:Protein kinase domain-containing protein n=1 Tax=Plakobranchus ocellatus TaxID=259542 RepID=A0AAV3YUY9_9GAST|nr:hypothetical protein PoB_001741100 [Plakobranchus ocellatus]
MLTVTPSRRATIDDALRHWWINFGHANMPNGEPYNPCGEDRKTNMTTSISSSLAQRLSNTPEAAVSLTEKRGPDSAQQHTRRRRHSLDIQRPSGPNDGDSSLFEPPAIIHQRNQSSLSSDSDAELEFFRAPRWTQPQPALQEEKPLEQQPHGKRGWRLGQQRLAAGALDSTGNSVNSSGSASPAFNADDQRSSHENGRFSDDVEEKPDANKDMLHQKEEDKNGRLPSMLKLPPALMDILGGCSEKSLATLLSSDPEMNVVSFNPFGLLDDLNKNSKGDSVSCEISANFNNSELKLANNSISPNVDLCSVSHASDLTNNNSSNNDSNQGSLSHLGPTTPSLTTSPATNETFVFDSERKPKRSILKRRGKFSGGEAPEKGGNLQKDAEDDSQIPKSGGGHLPRRLPSFRDEAHGIFASKHRASQLLEEAAGGIVHESCSSALLHSHHTPWGRHNATPTSNPAPCAGQIASLAVPSTGASSCSSTTQRESVLNSNFSSHPECSSFPSLILVPSQISALPSPFSNVPANVEHEPSLCRHEDPCHMPSPSTFASEKFSIERCQATHLIPDAKVSDSLVKDDLNGAYAKSQTLNADISNGNFLPTTEACFTPSFKKNGDLSFNDAKGITTFTLAMTNVKTNMQATGAQSYGLPTTEPSEEKSESNATSSKITPANPSSVCATNNIVTTKLRVSSANSSPTRFSKTTSANGSSRSSASNSSGDSAYESSSLSPCPSTPSLSSFSSSSVTATVAKVIRRPASILRTSQLEQARNRLSVSSIGSNSSADILDLSYDSGDSDHYVNTEIEPARQTSSPECHGAASQKRDVREMLPSGSAMEPESLHIDKTMAFGDFEPRIPYRERAIPFDDLEPNMPCDDPDTEVPTQLTQNTGAMNTQEDLMYPCNLTRDSKQNSRTSLPEDVDLMIFPDEGHGVKLSASNRYTHVSPLEAAATTVLQTNHEGCETSSISPHNLNSRENSFCGGLGIEKDPLLFKPVAELDSAKSRLFQEDLFGTTTGAADRLSRPVVSNAGSTEQCFETMMSTLDLEQPQSMSTLDLQQPQSQGPGSHLEGVNIEAAESMVQITECGSPLLYRLTREAQTWL